jgi:pimeloyl-ACP methyl ester carboxylesterase
MTVPAMQLTDINGVNLDVLDQGSGDPVMFIHGSMGDECYPVLAEPAVADRFRLIHYHRRGWGDSELPPDSSLGYENEAADCQAVLQHLDVERAHLVGQSGGASLVLEMALRYPDSVHTLAVSEPGLRSIMGSYPEFTAAAARAAVLYQSGDRTGALDTAFREIIGADYRSRLDRTMPPGWFDRWVDDADTLFRGLAANSSWTFTREDAGRIGQPVLNMVGAESRPYFRESYDTIRSWLPYGEHIVVPDAAHGPLSTNPTATAGHLADFFSRHPSRQA